MSYIPVAADRDTEKRIQIISWNIEGLKSSIDDRDFIEFIRDCDILFISETWQKDNEDYQIKGYKILTVPRPESIHSRRGHGGICLFYKECLQDGIDICEIDNKGIIWIKLCKTYFGFENDLYICFVYIPPCNSVYYQSHEEGFFEVIEQKLRFYQCKGKVGIVGDLNARCGERLDFIQDIDRFNKFIFTADNDDTGPYDDTYGVFNG